MLHITFNSAHKAGACTESYRKLAKSLGGVKAYGRDTPIPLTRVLEICGLADTLWALRCTKEPAEKFSRELACRYAEHVLHYYEDVYPDDKRPRLAIEAARKYNDGQITLAELGSAAWSAGSAAESAAEAAAWSAGSAAWSAAWSAEAAAWSADRSAARSAEREWQAQTLKEMLEAHHA